MNRQLNRRQFLAHSLSGGALLIAAPLLPAIEKGSEQAEEANATQLSLLAKIHSDNRITFYYPSPEMGQGVDTSLAQLFIEELGGDIELVSVEPMPYQVVRDQQGEIKPAAVPQFSGGSTSVSRNFSLLREAGAGTRQLLLQAAAKRLQQPLDSLRTEKSFVVGADGARVSFGELAPAAAQEKLSEDFVPTLTDPGKWRTIGKARASQQLQKIVTGQPLYGMDMQYPDAKVAVIARSPWLDGDVKSVNSKSAEKLPGVHAVVTLPRPQLDQPYTYLAGGVAVVADDFWTAKKARDLLEIEWDKGPHTQESTASLHQQCDELLQGKGQIVRNDGDLPKVLASAQKVISRTYVLPTVSHAQLEPQNCIAHVTDEFCKVIGPFQGPGGASRFAEQITGLDRTTASVEVHYTRLGGGFGRRLTSDHAAEAITVSKLSGFPVKLIWTREDDLANDFYRPMGHHQLTAALDAKGKVIGWSHRLAGRPKHYRRAGKKPEELYQADIYTDDFPAGLVENLQYEYLVAQSGLPQGSWRAPAHTANAFVVQSFLDEVARESGQDPLALRLAMLGRPQELPYGQHGGPVFDTGRMAGVLKQVAKMADWGRKMPAGRGLGLSGHFTFGGYCAQVADVELDEQNGFKVLRVFTAIDVGTVINPDGLAAQMEGGINDGLSTARGQRIMVDGGRVVSDNFDTYPMLRIADSVPQIDVHIVDSSADPGGAGEMGIPPLSAAVANAVTAAGGPRMRVQPFSQAI